MIYNREHSITFVSDLLVQPKVNSISGLVNDSRNTWDDWHLIPKIKPSFNPPSVKTHYIDIPGSDGMIDLTEVVDGYPKYSNREGSLEFIVADGYEEWNYLYKAIKGFLHGKEMSVILNDDPNYKYRGRFSINEFSSEKTNSKIVINYSLNPFRTEITDSITPWKWDPFNFYDGVITYEQIYYLNDPNLPRDTGPMPFVGVKISPIFRVENSSNLKLIFNEVSYDLKDGDNYFPDVFLYEGNYKEGFMFKGIGTVKIIYNIRRL